MKKIIIISFILISFQGYSQITLDFQTDVIQMRTVRLSNTVTKYSRDFSFANDLTDFILYNLDGTIYKTIYLPPKPDPSASVYFISDIAESLFDNDSTNIEYLICYTIDSAGYSFSQTQIVREDGTILLNEPKASPFFWPSNFDDASIYQTEEGTKLRFYYTFATGINFKTKVFNLPGKIPTSITEDNNLAGSSAIIYPNPNNGSFYLKFTPGVVGVNNLELFSSTGSLLETFRSNDNPVHINTCGLPNGLYFLNTTSHNFNTKGKVLIKK